MSAVDVKNGKILRIRPQHYEERYSKEEIGPWSVGKDGKVYTPPLKGLIAPYQLAYKKRVYSPNRIKYPLKRVDWDPKGERNPQNRGKSKYVRISWDEATDIIAEEIRRIHDEYGPCGILAHGDGHGETKIVHGPHAVQMRLLNILGGYTQAVRNADSWEGWYWGAKHVWGQGENGLMLPADNLLNDVTQNTDLLIHIGADLETTPWGFSGQFPSGVLFYWSELGKKQVFVSPDLNYSGAVHADKWIPVLPNTDAALAPRHRLHVDGRGYVRQRVRIDSRGRLRQVRELRHGRRGWNAQDSRMGVREVRRARMDDKGACPGMGPHDHIDHALLRRQLRQGTVLARAGAAGMLSPGHAGPGQTWRPPVLQDGRRHAVDDRHARTDTQAGQHSHHEGGLAQWGADCMSRGNRRSPRPLSTKPS